MEIRKRVLREEHFSTLISTSNHAYALCDLDLTEKARGVLAHAVNVTVDVLGDKHSLTMQRKQQLEGWDDEVLRQHDSPPRQDSLNNAVADSDASGEDLGTTVVVMRMEEHLYNREPRTGNLS